MPDMTLPQGEADFVAASPGLPLALTRFPDAERLRLALAHGRHGDLAATAAAAWYLRQYDGRQTIELAEPLLSTERVLVGDEPSLLQCRGYLKLALAEALSLRGEHERAQQLAALARRCFSVLGLPAALSDVDWIEAAIANDQGDYRTRNRLMRSAVKRAVEAEDEERQQAGDLALACFAAFDDPAAAETEWRERVRPLEASPSAALRAFAHVFLFQTEWSKGATDQALRHGLLSVQASEECGSMRRVVLDSAKIAMLLLDLGDLDAAADRLSLNLDVARQCGWPHPLSWTLSVFAHAMVKLNQPERAVALARESVETIAGMPRSTHYLTAQLALAEASLASGDIDTAEQSFGLVANPARHFEIQENLAYALLGLARVAHKRGQLALARQYCLTALDSPATDPDLRMQTLRHLSRVLEDIGIEGLDADAGPDASRENEGTSGDEPGAVVEPVPTAELSVALLQQALDISVAQLDGAGRHATLLEMAERLERRGRLPEALTVLRQSVEALAAEKSRAAARQCLALDIRHRTDQAIADARHHREHAQREAARARELQAANQEISHTLNALRAAQAQLLQRNHELEEANARIGELSLTDPLTGLRNRRFLTQVIDNAIAETRRAHAQPVERAEHLDRGRGDLPPGRELLFFLIDIDHFKQLNDHYGHAVGDVVLTRIAERLKAVTREQDLLVRWGGEEFLVVVRQVRQEDASVIAHRLLGAIKDQPVEVGGEVLVRRTASMGVAVYPHDAGDSPTGGWEQVLEAADKRLYEAKRRGRDGWVGLA